MNNSGQTNNSELILQPDIDLVNRQPDAETREIVACTISTYRQPNKLSVGDAAPDLHLTSLGSGLELPLVPRDGSPLVLFFGSYT